MPLHGCLIAMEGSEDTETAEGFEHIGHAAWRALASACRLRKDFLHEQVTGAGEQGEEEPTQPAPDAVRARGTGRMR